MLSRPFVLLHPLPPDADRADVGSLRRVAPQAASVAVSDQVRKALFSFPSTSGAGRSVMPCDLLLPLLLLRLLSEVVSIMLRGEVPEAIRPYVCGASIMDLRKPNGSLRPIAVGETVRRFASKIAVDYISEHARVILEPLEGAKRSSTRPASCSTVTVRMRARLHFLLISPTRSTRFIGRLCCGLFVFISLRSLRGLTAVIFMIASSSPTGRPPPPPARFSSRLPSTLLFCKPVLPPRPCTRVGSIFAPFTLMTGSVLVLPRRFGTFSLLWFVVSGVLGSRSTWTRPRLFLHVPPPSPFLLATSRVAFGLGLPISSFWCSSGILGLVRGSAWSARR